MWRKNGLVSPDIVPAAGTFGMFSFGRDFVRTGVSPVCIHHIERLLFRGGGGRVPRIYELFIRSTYTKLMAAIWLRAYTSTRGAQMSRQQFSNPLATKEKSGSWLGRGVRLVQTGNFASQTLTTFSFFSSAVLRKCRKGNHRQNVDIRRTKRNSKSCSDRSFFFFSFSLFNLANREMCCLLSQLSARWPKGGANQSAAALAVSSAKRRRRRRRSGKKRPACVYSWESLRVVQSVRTTTGSSSSLSRSSPTAHFFFVVVSFFSQKKEEKENIYNSSRLSLSLCVCAWVGVSVQPARDIPSSKTLSVLALQCVCLFFFLLFTTFFFFFWILLPPFSTRAPLLLQEKLGVSSSLQRGRLLEAIFFLLKRYIYFWVETRGGFEPGFQFFFFLGVDDILKKTKNKSV